MAFFQKLSILCRDLRTEWGLKLTPRGSEGRLVWGSIKELGVQSSQPPDNSNTEDDDEGSLIVFPNDHCSTSCAVPQKLSVHQSNDYSTSFSAPDMQSVCVEEVSTETSCQVAFHNLYIFSFIFLIQLTLDSVQ